VKPYSFISYNKIVKPKKEDYMNNNFFKKFSRPLTLVLLSFLFLYNLSTCPPDSISAEPLPQLDLLSSGTCNPLIVYYSRSGNSRLVADTLKEQLSCKVACIQSTKNREGFLGVLTCVLDQLMDREDIIKPLATDPKDYNPVILVSPIWIGKLASPARTFIKQTKLEGKDMYLVLTYNGRLNEEKEKNLAEAITAQGVQLKGIYKIITKEKTEEEIKKEVRSQLEQKPLLTKAPMNLS
jgi:flavodoxin